MPDNSTPRIPEVGERVRLVGTLVEVTTPPPIQPPDEYLFRVEYGAVEIRLNSRCIKEVGSYNDWHGDAVATAIAEAKTLCEQDGIKPDSELEVVVIREVSYQRMRLSRSAEPYAYDRQFSRFASIDRPRCPVPPSSKEVAWTSRRPDEGPAERTE